MTVTTNELGQNNLFAKEPPMVVEDYNRKGLFSPMQQREMYNGRWAMMGIVSGLLSYAITGKLFFGIFWFWMQFTQESLIQAYTDLGWDMLHDDIHVEIGGTQVYEIDGAGTKWAPVKGTRKYNKDAFIVIKNRSRDPFEPSQPNPDLKAHHAES